MAYVNDLQRYSRSEIGVHLETFNRGVDTLLQLLAPACPHITAELWSRRHDGAHLHEDAWPVADPAMLVDDTVTMVVQVAGKVRDRIEVAADSNEATCIAAAMASEKVQAHLDGEPRKVVAKPPKLVNIVP
jgi:leucyl-tRNA synthetase